MNKIKEKTELNEDAFYTEDGSEEAEKGYIFILRFLLFFLLGAGFGCFDGFTDMSPFALAFLSAVPFNYCAASFIGSTVGYFLNVEGFALIKYTGAMIILCIFRLLMLKRFNEKEGSFICAVVSFCIMTGTGLIHLWFNEVHLEAFLLLVCESLLTFAVSCFFMNAVRLLSYKGAVPDLSEKNILSLVLSVSLTLMCLSSIDLQGISIGCIGVCIIVMFVCIYKGTSAGTVCGVLAGIFLSFLPDSTHLFPCFVLSSLFAGFLSSAGQTVISVVFSVTYIVTALIFSDISQSWASLLEPLIACALFIIIPANKISELEEYIDKKLFPSKNTTDLAVSASLQSASENISSVAMIVTDVSDKLDKIINPEVNRLFSSLQQKVCDGCEKKPSCWNKNFDSTAGDILSVMGVEKSKGGKIGLSVTCKRYDLLCNTVFASYPSYSAAVFSKMKISEMRRLLTDQFIGMSDFLSELAENVNQSRTRDKSKSSYLKTALRDSGIPVEELDCFIFKGRATVEMTVYEIKDRTIKKIKPLIEFITKRYYEEPEIENKNALFRITLKEKAACKIKSGYSQRPLKAGSLCGDSLSIFTSDFNFFNAVISDGMGTGSRAAIDSTMTASIIERLICSDFSFQSALKILNSALIMKSTDESIATLDAVQINPYTCKAVFYKAGGAISFIRQGDSVTAVEKPSLPLGIIRNVTLAKQEMQLKIGDIILLVSDGVTNQDCGWINDELLAWSKSDMQSLAGHIASLARLRSEKSTKDDITVVALRVTVA